MSNNTDNILVIRNNQLYRSNLSSLSAYLYLKYDIDKIVRYLDDLSSKVDAFTEQISSIFYSSSDLTSNFIEKQYYLSSDEYLELFLKSNSTDALSTLLTVPELNQWADDLSHECVDILIETYGATTRLINDLPTATREELKDYSIKPSYETIVDEGYE